MSKKKAADLSDSVMVARVHYDAMVETMIELAMRNAPTEAIVLRCAKAGAVKEVVKHITRMRVYAKKHHTPQREGSAGDGAARPARKKGSKKKRTAGTPIQRENIGEHVPALDEM